MIKINIYKYYYLLLTLIILIFIFFLINYFYSNNTYNNNDYDNNNYNNNYDNNNIKFMNKKDTQYFINNDEDNYIKNLSIYDLKARKVKTNDEYKKKVINNCLDFNELDKNKIILCSNKAKKFFNNNIPWKFALINNIYEEGMPHTRKDIIFLSPNVINSNNDDLTKILIHESVHIYQRYNKNIIKKYLEDNKYSISRKRDNIHLIRANPDLDEYIYKDEKGNELIAYYNNENPVGLNDITIKNYSYEHPFEKMAYEYGEKYLQSLLYKYKNV
jgi:hypothetical protein